MAMPPRPTANSPIVRILGLLDGVKLSGNGYEAKCPAHDDRHASLSIAEGDDGRALLDCKTGCQTADVCAAIGLTFADLFEPNTRRFRVVGRDHTYRHVRRDKPNGEKDIYWETDGRPGLNGTRLEDLPLYGLSSLEGAAPDAFVYLAEGEKAAQALIDHGALAVGTVTGADGTPTAAVLSALDPYKVVLWPDNDDPGRKHMHNIAAVLNMRRPPYWLDWADAPSKGDAADWFERGGDVDGLTVLIRAWQIVQTTALAPPATTVSWNIIASTDLARLDLPEQKWAVPGIVPEGVLLVAGKPKFGKSWWVFDLCTAIATGGKAWGRIAVEQGEVLYITYEDSYRRLQDRQQRLVGHERGIPGLDFVTDCPRSDEGGIELVLDWVQHHPRARLIVIDPLEYWRPQEDSKKQLYRQDYDSLRPIVEAARSLGISVIVVHHCNKMPNPDDPFDAISGTTGLQGVADAIGVFRKEHGMADAVLFIKGKDVDSAELAYKTRISDPWPAPAWELLGSGEEYRLSRERFDVLTALWREPWQTPLSLAELMDPPVAKGTMRKRLFDMAHDGLVRISDGKYAAGLDHDAYLAKYGHENSGTPSNHGNASNAVTPTYPSTVPPQANSSDLGVTGVTDVTDIPTVTPVTDSQRERSLCGDCGWETPGPWAMRCESCQAKRQKMAGDVEELPI